MEYYEGTCTACGHTSRWTDRKTTMGLDEAGVEAFHRRLRTCPSCGQETREAGLDHASDGAKQLDGAIAGAVKTLLGAPDPGAPVMTLEEAMEHDFKVGDPVVCRGRYGRITGMLGDAYQGIYPKLEFHTPHGSQQIAGRCWFQPIASPEDEAALEEFEGEARGHPEAEWYGGRLPESGHDAD